jgi:hypothetical protein
LSPAYVEMHGRFTCRHLLANTPRERTLFVMPDAAIAAPIGIVAKPTSAPSDLQTRCKAAATPATAMAAAVDGASAQVVAESVTTGATTSATTHATTDDDIEPTSAAASVLEKTYKPFDVEAQWHVCDFELTNIRSCRFPSAACRFPSDALVLVSRFWFTFGLLLYSYGL